MTWKLFHEIHSQRYLPLTFACLALCLVLTPFIVTAQDETPNTLRDPIALAERYLDYNGEPVILPPTPIYEVGDTQQFWVAKGDTPSRVNATLAAAAPSLYLWVEEGLDYDAGQLGAMAAQLSQVYDLLRLRENYARPLMLPGTGPVSDPTSLISIPDVDNDPHLNILYTTDLKADRDTIFNPNDSLPATLAPGGYSNQQELFYVNTTPYTDVPLHDQLYFNMVAGTIYPFAMSQNNPAQAPWLVEALNLALRLRLQQRTITANDAAAFLEAPNTSLVRLPTLTNRSQTINGQQMFLNYLLQRYGVEPYIDLFLQPGDGMAAVDAVLLQNNLIDPATGGEINARAAFADFVLANSINTPIGDGRFAHVVTPIESDQRSNATEISDLSDGAMTEQTVNQFGSVYVWHTARNAETVEFSFDGAETVARLQMPDDFDPDEPFYWSGRAPGQNTTMTRSFDLSDTDQATLTFDVWHDLADQWNYGYVSVSTDEGATWTPLPAESEAQGTTMANRHGVSYGPGYTGISNPLGPRPFPIMGVVIQDDGMTLGEITPGSPADQAELQPGDVIIGYDGELWADAPNILGLLAQHSPGDTINFYVQRGDTRMDVPMVLGAHPTRVVQPEPLWMEQTVDLTPFTGQEVLLRFEYISLPGRENGGFAVNHIAIPEIGYEDEGDWTLNGWQNVTNTLPQQWLVQAWTTGTETTPARVRPLIGVDSAETNGDWKLSLQPNETLIVGISGLNDDTYEPATFNAEMREG